MDFLSKIPKRNKNVAWRTIDDEAAAIPLEDQTDKEEKLALFNETATHIWELIDGKLCVGAIIKKLINGYEIEPDEVQSQVKNFLEELALKRLIDF